MEFSILIPVYNTHITGLAEALAKQAARISDTFQILFIDDRSELSISYINQKVQSLDHVEYEVLTTNIGRAAIRNLLFSKAKYEKCIIMDGDVSILRDDIIKLYVDNLQESEILVGGHVYQENKPDNQGKYLHWLYGSQIESKSAEERQKQPYYSFMTSNFACNHSTFNQLKFDENLKGYGHEDTLFGLKAQEMGIKITHIDNPVRHDGLDDYEDFLAKQKNAVLNLKKLYAESPNRSALKKSSKLIKLATKPLPFFLLKALRPSIERNLRSDQPNLSRLQIQKLLWWHYG